MINRSEIEKISGLQHDQGQLLSVYLPLVANGSYDPNIELKNLLRDAEHDYQKSRSEEIPDDMDAVLDEIRVLVRDDASSYGRSVAIFATPDGIVETLAIPATVKPHAVIDRRGDIAPLVHLITDYPAYCTCVISRDQARILLGRFKEIEEHESIEDDMVPGQHDQGGWSQSRYERHIEDHVHRHFKNVADTLFKLHEEKKFNVLILAGPEEVVASFRDVLHPYVTEKVIGDVRLLMEANINDVQQQSLEVVEHYNIENRKTLIEQIKGESLADDLGVQGLRDTLSALQQGQVLSLAVDHSIHSPGVYCIECGSLSLTSGPNNTCPYCTGKIEDVSNIIPSITAAAFEQGAEIAVIEHDDLKEDLARLGGIGALLRFKLEPQSE